MSLTRRVGGVSFVTGMGGFIAGYGLSAVIWTYFLWLMPKNVNGDWIDAIYDAPVERWKVQAWEYFSGHYVPIELIDTESGVQIIHLTYPPDYTYIIPPLILLAIGFGLTRWWLEYHDDNSMQTYGQLVSAVTAGYLLFAVIVSQLSEFWSYHSLNEVQTVQPDFVLTVVIAGILYPVVFVTAGVIIADILYGY